MQTQSTQPAVGQLPWRVIDIVVASVLGVAVGLLFWIWNLTGGTWYPALDKLLGGVGGLMAGPWLIGGVLGGLIVRKPGAALYVELLAAAVSALIGNQWGITTLYSGLAQGLGAEVAFLAFRYRSSGLLVALLAGLGAAVFEWVMELVTVPTLPFGKEYLAVYFVTMVISGIVLAGGLGAVLTRALVATGALDRFPVGRSARVRV